MYLLQSQVQTDKRPPDDICISFVNLNIYLIKFFVASSLCECVLSCVYEFLFLIYFWPFNLITIFELHHWEKLL